MRRFAMLSSLLLVLLAACGSEKRDTSRTDTDTLTVIPAPATIDDVAWLVGTWEDAGPDETMHEEWWREGGTLLGSAESVSAGTPTFSEDMRIEPRDGSLVLVVRVGDDEPVTFTATRVKRHEITFENPNHDYPQRIFYQLASKDSLFARIDGATDEETMKEDFSYRRIR